MKIRSSITILLHERKKASKHYFVKRYRTSYQETLKQKNIIPNIFKLGSDQKLDAMSA